MLYLLDVEIDYSRMGERIADLREAEHARVGELVREGVVLVEWLKASGRGVFAVWDCPSHEALRRTITSVPMASYLGKVELHPLTEHPLFPGGRTAAYPTPEGHEPR